MVEENSALLLTELVPRRRDGVGSGVPKGSILGPILFLLYSNDMPGVVSSSVILMFADDSFLKRIKTINPLTGTNCFQNDLDDLSLLST